MGGSLDVVLLTFFLSCQFSFAFLDVSSNRKLILPPDVLAQDDSCSNEDHVEGPAKHGCAIGALQTMAKFTPHESKDVKQIATQDNDFGLRLLVTSSAIWQMTNEKLLVLIHRVEASRPSLSVPVLGGTMLCLSMVALFYFKRTFAQTSAESDLPCDSDLEHLSRARIERADSDDCTASTNTPSEIDDVASAGKVDFEHPREITMAHIKSVVKENAEDSRGPMAPLSSLFRFATRQDVLLTLAAICCALVHGASMPLAFFLMEDLFKAVNLPNDDGSLPPQNAPHNFRDSEVRMISATYVLLAAVVLIARSSGIYLVVKAADRQVISARRQFFRQVLSQSPCWHDMHNSAALSAQLVNDTHYLRDGIGERVVDLVRASAIATAALVMACIKDWKLTLVMGLIMPVATLCIFLCIDVQRSHGQVLQRCYTKASHLSQTAAELIRTVTAFNGQRNELQAFQAQLDKAKSHGIQIGMVGGFCMGLVSSVLIVSLSLGLYFGSIWVLEGYKENCWAVRPPFGSCRTGGSMLSAMYIVIWGFTMGLGSMSISTEAIANARSAIQRISTIIDEPLAIKGGTKIFPEVKGEVFFDDVVFSYPTRPDVLAIQNLTVRILAGSTTAFVGHSGSGKSTSIGLLLRFYQQQHGTIYFDGHDIRTLNLKWLRSKMSLVEQMPMLFHSTVYENIACGCEREVTTADIEWAAKLASAHTFITGFPKGYGTMVGEGGAQLSGGQKQRIAIARALIRQPAVLLLDEATSALDVESELEVQAALDELLKHGGRTTVVIAHRLSTVRAADKICVMGDGKLLEQGTHEELIAKEHSAYRDLVHFQLSVSDKRSDKVRAAGTPVVSQSPAHPEPVEKESSPAVRLPALGGAQNLLEVNMPNPEAAPEDESTNKSVNKTANQKATVDFSIHLKTQIAVAKVWALARQDWVYYLFGLASTLLGALVMPFFGVQWAQTINLFNRPPAVQDRFTGDWYRSYNDRALVDNVTSLCIMMQFLALVSVLQSTSSSWNFAVAGENLCCRVRAMLFKSMLRQEMTWYDQEGTAVLLSRMSHEVPMLKSLVGSNIASAASAGGTSLLGLIFAAYYSWRFTLCILLALPLIAIGPLAIMLNWRKCEGDFSGGVVSESINSIKSVAAFALEDRQMIKYEKLLQEHMKGERAIRIASGFGTGISAAGVFLTMAMAVFAVNYLVSAGLMHPDQATFVLFTLMTCITSFGEFARWFADSRLPQESARRIFEIIDRVSLIDSMSEDGLKPLEVAGCIEFQDVVFSYSTRPNVTVLDGFTLTIKPNTTVALVGPSGCGKSTTISLLQRFYDPHKGMVRLDSRDIRDLNIGWMRAQMSLVQQEPVLFSCSVLENLRYGCPDASMDTVLAAARSANANDFILTLPKQYDTQVGHRGTELSGGQKQRIAIARALIRDPAILLLDEATSALDAGSEHLVQLALDTLLKAKRRTTIIVAHRLSTIRSADQICVIREGKVAELGSHDDLCAVSGGHYARFLAKQEITV